MISLAVTALGAYAFEEFNRSQAGQVFGVTSAGVFIKAAQSERILFLTEGQRRGPVSINLRVDSPALASVRQGAPAQLGEDRLVLPENGLVVSADSRQVWNAPQPPNAAPDLPGARGRLSAVAAALLSARPGKGLSWLLAAWLNGSPAVDENTDPLGILASARQAAAALARHDPEKTAEGLAKILGYGPGLTPSGDDFVLGVVLLANRWLAGEWGLDGLSELNRRVTAAARKSTTALSATLIECAAAGQADEGVVKAADYLASGVGEEAACVEALLGWGANSGIDTLAGMAVAVGQLRLHPRPISRPDQRVR